MYNPLAQRLMPKIFTHNTPGSNHLHLCWKPVAHDQSYKFTLLIRNVSDYSSTKVFHHGMHQEEHVFVLAGVTQKASKLAFVLDDARTNSISCIVTRYSTLFYDTDVLSD